MDFNQNTVQSPAKTLKTLTIIHLALLAGMVLFAGVVYSITPNPVLNFKDTDEHFLILVPFMAITGIAASVFVSKQQIAKAKEGETLNAKIAGYLSASIIKFALLEGPALFGIVGFLLTTNLLYLLISIVIMLYFLSQRPVKQNVIDQLGLSYEEGMELG